MDIEHAIRPFGDKAVAQYPHIAGQHDIFGVGLDQSVVHDSVMLLARLALVGVGEGGNAFRLRQRQAGGVGAVRRHQHDFIGASGCLGGINKRGHIRAAAGN